MIEAAPAAAPLWPLVVYAAAVFLLVGGIIGLSYVLGERHRESQTGDPYESGIVSTGSARLRFPVHYYLVAMFFVIFDVETAFIISWALAFKELGKAGYIAVAAFISVLFAILFFEWKMGALDIYATRRESLKRSRKPRRKGSQP
jgi:NADH-quinone oxidoreductase subunit A